MRQLNAFFLACPSGLSIFPTKIRRKANQIEFIAM
jgi:hypothetical protein